jgi:hypothetical protein
LVLSFVAQSLFFLEFFMKKRLKVLMLAGVLATVALINGRPTEASADGAICPNEEFYSCIVVPITVCSTDEEGRTWCDEREPLIILYSTHGAGGHP